MIHSVGVGEREEIMSFVIDYHRPSTGSEQYCFRPQTGPLGAAVESSFGRVGDTAIIDAASACGLQMVPVLERNPLVTTSRGLGGLLLAAYGCGCTRVLVGIGGTATCDGGEGMMSVPGLKDLRGKISVEILADVNTPFLGPRGAVRTVLTALFG